VTGIKVLLVGAVVVLLAWAFRNRARVGMRASVRLGSLLLSGAAILSVVNPDVPQRVAEAVGVTRGTDLVLYLLIVTFAATTLGGHFRFRSLEQRLVQIVRAAAIRDALETHGRPDSPTGP
jgi:hypothetical protein